MNTPKGLLGRAAIVKVSDPWNLGESIAWRPLEATIVQHGTLASGYGTESEAIILKVNEPFEFEGTRYAYLVGSPRHEGDTFDGLDDGGEVFCSLARVDQEQVESESPFDMSWWRGGGGIIGSLSLA